jgi:hypothetical protein
MNEKFFRQCIHALNSIRVQLDTGIVLQDLNYVGETTKRLKWVIEQMEVEVGPLSSSVRPPVQPASPKVPGLALALRQDEVGIDDEVPVPFPDASTPCSTPAEQALAATSAFFAGQIWQRANGSIVFRIVAVNEEAIEIQWNLRGKLEVHDWVKVRALELFVEQNAIQPKA